MLSIVGMVLAVLGGFDVTIGEVSSFNLLCFAVAFVALHLAVPLGFGTRRA